MVFAAALTGIQSASSELAVIGNNIANASTHGFKSSRTEFADIYTSSGGSNAIGAGVGVSSVSQKHSQGGIAFTNSNLDLAISGEGYFQVKDSTGITYTRAGSFGVDDLGKIVNSSGQALQGKLAGSDGVIGGSQVDLVLPSGSSAPSATKSINLGLNLDSRSTPPAITPFDSSDANSYNNTSSTTIYDSFGGAHVMQTYYVKDSTDNQWTANFELIANGTTSQLGGTPITFTDAGVFSGLGTAIPPATITSNKVNLIHDFPDGPADPANLSFTMDFNNVALGGTTQYGAEFSIQSSNQDGYSEGSLQNIEVSSKGVIIGRFSNGQTRDLAQVTTADQKSVV